MQFLEVGENVGGVGGHVRHDIDPANDTTAIDQERVSFREVRVLLTRISHNPVVSADAVIDVAEEGVVETLRLGELEVLGRSVERSAEDGAVGIGEFSGAVTQRLAFKGSTGCRCLGVPPQQHPTIAQVDQADVVAMLIREAEVGGGRSNDEHPDRLRALARSSNKTLRGHSACHF